MLRVHHLALRHLNSSGIAYVIFRILNSREYAGQLIGSNAV